MRRALSRLGMFLPLLVACGGDSTGPTMNTVAGSYVATTFTATDASGSTDLLAGGASIAATLNADGTTTGALHVPAALNNGTPIDEDLTGTWALNGRRSPSIKPAARCCRHSHSPCTGTSSRARRRSAEPRCTWS